MNHKDIKMLYIIFNTGITQIILNSTIYVPRSDILKIFHMNNTLHLKYDLWGWSKSNMSFFLLINNTQPIYSSNSETDTEMWTAPPIESNENIDMYKHLTVGGVNCNPNNYYKF